MEHAPEAQRAAALAASEGGRLAEEYRFWLPLAEAGDPQAQGAVGVLLAYGMHRVESHEQWAANPAVDEAAALADRDAGARYLAAASAAGFGPASFNLAGLYVAGYGGGACEDRKARGRAVRPRVCPGVHRVRVAYARSRAGAAVSRCHGTTRGGRAT